jgi:hypothetical protein
VDNLQLQVGNLVAPRARFLGSGAFDTYVEPLVKTIEFDAEDRLIVFVIWRVVYTGFLESAYVRR